VSGTMTSRIQARTTWATKFCEVVHLCERFGRRWRRFWSRRWSCSRSSV